MQNPNATSISVKTPKASHLLFDLACASTDNTLVQLVRYTFVGGVAFSVDFASLYVLTEYCGIHYLVSAAIAFLFGMLTNYTLSVRWVFATRALRERPWAEFVVFSLIGLVGLVINETLMWSLTEYAGFYYLVSKVASTFFVYLWNFFARKIVLFR